MSFESQITPIARAADAAIASAQGLEIESREAMKRSDTLLDAANLVIVQLRAEIAALKGGTVTPPVANKPPGTVIGPKPPEAPRGIAKSTTGVQAKVIADRAFTAGTTGDAALMIRDDNASADRVTVEKPVKYGMYVEGAQNVHVRDLKMVGPSAQQSGIRTARAPGQTKSPSVTFERLDLTAPNNNGLGRANIRGEGERDFIDVKNADLQWASGPLSNDDGGDQHGRRRTVDVVFDNGDAISAAIDRAAPKDRAGVLAAIRAAKPMVGGKPYMLTDDIWAKTMAYRDAEVGGWSNDTWTRCQTTAPLGLMPGAVVELDGTNEINVSGKAVIDYAMEYPRKANLLPGDKPRKPPILRGNGDKVTCKEWGVPDSVLRGTFLVNGVLKDYGN